MSAQTYGINGGTVALSSSATAPILPGDGMSVAVYFNGRYVLQFYTPDTGVAVGNYTTLGAGAFRYAFILKPDTLYTVELNYNANDANENLYATIASGTGTLNFLAYKKED